MRLVCERSDEADAGELAHVGHATIVRRDRGRYAASVAIRGDRVTSRRGEEPAG
jgi:hypothetical protein